MSVNISLLKGGTHVTSLGKVPSDPHWQIQFISEVRVHNPQAGQPGERKYNMQDYVSIYVYDNQAAWEEDVLALYESDHNRTDFHALGVGSQVKPRTTITLDYSGPGTPSRLELLAKGE